MDTILTEKTTSTKPGARSWAGAKRTVPNEKAPVIAFGPEVCGNLESALSREWLETNGIGGFASSTIVGLNTRRYHGLLTAALRPPVGRTLLLSKLEETLVVGDRRVDLCANEYAGAIHPEGYRYLTQFRLDPFPIFTYEIEGITIRKSVFMVHGENATVIQYQFEVPPGLGDRLRFEVRPLIAFRDYHGLAHENSALQAALRVVPGLVTITPYADLPSLHIAHDADEVATASGWYRNFAYRLERERGLDDQEDLFNPFVLTANLNGRSQVAIIASTAPREASKADELRNQEIARRSALLETPLSEDPLVCALVQAADQYIVTRGDGHSVIAGYPWFGDWGRDTMIALPGLTLVTGRFEIARSIIDAFAQHIDQGMLPNRFPDAGEQLEYNTVDATLWYFEAIRTWLECTGDYEYARNNWYAKLHEIVDWHVKGTRHGIRVDDDGLLRSGEPGVQLTWMDAKVGDWVVTQREGKAVEIQALWYNALCVMEDLAARFGDATGKRRFFEAALRARSSFNQSFWNSPSESLYDVLLNDGSSDISLRPNQILAASLHYSMLAPEKALQVVETVQRELLTPMGLRTLARNDSHYVAHYEGSVQSRDAAYHQGTVWPWLMGPFVTAFLRVNGFTADACRQAKEWLTPFISHVCEAGLGHISEIFDAEPPHMPRGCFAQAWSVAEVLRAAVLVEQSMADR